jgi:hypothetical protein
VIRLEVALALLGAACARPRHLVMAEPGTARPGASVDASRSTQAPVHEPARTGTWRGEGTQSDGQRWPLVVRWDAGESDPCGRVEYPSVGCRGTLTCRTPNGWDVVDEHIERGPCLDGGTFRFLVVGDAVEWTWQQQGGATNDSRLTARGTLRRQNGADEPSSVWEEDEE